MEFQTRLDICDYMVSLLPNNIANVLEPTPGEGNIVQALHGYQVTAPIDFWQQEGFFDAIVMNPPFSPMEMGYKILYRCMDMTNIIIALMPWLTLINSEKRTHSISFYGLRSVTHLPRNAFAGSRVQTCILEMCRGWKGKTLLQFYGEGVLR